MESYGAGEWGGGLCHAVVLWGRRGGRGLTHGETPLSTHPPTPIFSCPEWWSQTLVPQNFHTVMQMICIVFVNTLSFSTLDGPHYQCHKLLWQRNPPFEKLPPQSHRVASHAWHKWWFCAIASENHWYWARTRSKTLKLGNSWMDCIVGAVGGERGKCIKWDALEEDARHSYYSQITHSSAFFNLQCNAKRSGHCKILQWIVCDAGMLWHLSHRVINIMHQCYGIQKNATQQDTNNAMQHGEICHKSRMPHIISCVHVQPHIIFCKVTDQTGRAEVCQIWPWHVSAGLVHIIVLKPFPPQM